MSSYQSPQDGPKATILGKLVVLVFIAACGFGAWKLYRNSRPASSGSSGSPGRNRSGAADASSIEPAQGEIGIAYGTEKKSWLEWAAREFATTDAGRNVKINLIPMGSLEAAQALVAGDQRIHVWAPASSLYKETFVQDWQVKYSNQPILKEESLALSPMVFVMWKERYDAFKAKYGELNFDTAAKALAEPTGWEGIAGKGDWGLFKLGHTLPNESNSGLMTLVLMAYDAQQKNKGLTPKDVLDPKFQQQLTTIERSVSLASSTGTMMREMVLKGPSAYDTLFVYESVAIDYVKSAAGRWGELQIIYPRRNIWNDNPYYVIDASWSTADQKKAAQAFLEFLMTERVQKEALVHGFRPGNPSVPVMTPESPFTIYQKFGLRNDIGQICDYPKADVLNNLLSAWQRTRS